MAIHNEDLGPKPQRPVRRSPVLAATIGVACLGAVVILGLVLPTFRQPLTPMDRPYHLQGAVSTDVFGSRPVSITFTSRNEIMQLTAPVKNNHYAIELPGGTNSFEVEVTWNSLPEVFGTCYAGTIQYNASTEAQATNNFRC